MSRRRCPTSRAGDLWLLGPHRVVCGDALNADVVARLLEDQEPILMVTDPPYGIELDSERRDRAGVNGGNFARSARWRKVLESAEPRYHAEPSCMKHRTASHTETSISGDARVDGSGAFDLVPSLQVAYVCHASKYAREVLDGLCASASSITSRSSGTRAGRS
jgi:hypothetical protein